MPALLDILYSLHIFKRSKSAFVKSESNVNEFYFPAEAFNFSQTNRKSSVILIQRLKREINAFMAFLEQLDNISHLQGIHTKRYAVFCNNLNLWRMIKSAKPVIQNISQAFEDSKESSSEVFIQQLWRLLQRILNKFPSFQGDLEESLLHDIRISVPDYPSQGERRLILLISMFDPKSLLWKSEEILRTLLKRFKSCLTFFDTKGSLIKRIEQRHIEVSDQMHQVNHSNEADHEILIVAKLRSTTLKTFKGTFKDSKSELCKDKQ
ncbi:unnamed protein product [Moneuplotes crassus]|uniref:Uncharacterized protein n=1 Tax=Euplotes crassus TaxID=5936 RepID=A0AAD1UES5_EUPCR|nr:unnamed protein product [Moneuplotes crassus]